MIGFAQPWALLALLSLPVILVLYSLRPERRRVVTSGNRLWQEALRQRRHGLGLEKLLRNLRLLLLLLFALLAALALGDPEWLARGADRGDVVLVLDTSASMQVEEAGGSRFELARREAARIVDELPSGARLLLMTSARHAALRSAFESDRRLLRERLAALAVSDEAGHPREALSLALSLLRARDRGRVLFLTDGAFERGLDFGAGAIEYRLFGSARDNVAITRFAVRPEPESLERFQVLVTVRSHARETLAVPLAVTLEGTTLVEETIDLAPGAERTRLWSFHGGGAGRARAVLDVDDALDVDDRAYAVLGGDERLRVLLLGEGGPYLLSALAALPNVTVTRLEAVPVEWLAEEVSRHDLVVLDRLPAPSLPAGAWLLVDSVPPGLPFTETGRVARPVLTGRAAGGILAGLDLGDLRVEEAARIRVDAGGEVQPLLRAEDTVLALAVIDGQRRIVYLGFDPARSDLPLKAAFPLLVRRIAGWLAPRAGRETARQVAAGETFSIPLPAGRERVVLRGPDNEAVVHEAPDGVLVVHDTARTGIHQYSFGFESGAVQRYFAVNLADAAESAVSPRAPVVTAPAAAAPVREARVTRSLWPWLAAGAALALLLEWALLMRGRARGRPRPAQRA